MALSCRRGWWTFPSPSWWLGGWRGAAQVLLADLVSFSCDWFAAPLPLVLALAPPNSLWMKIGDLPFKIGDFSSSSPVIIFFFHFNPHVVSRTLLSIIPLGFSLHFSLCEEGGEDVKPRGFFFFFPNFFHKLHHTSYLFPLFILSFESLFMSPKLSSRVFFLQNGGVLVLVAVGCVWVSVPKSLPRRQGCHLLAPAVPIQVLFESRCFTSTMERGTSAPAVFHGCPVSDWVLLFGSFLAAALLPELCQRFPFSHSISAQFWISGSNISSIG